MGPILLGGKVLPIFPCLANKKPATPRGFKNATTDPAAIAGLWWSHWGPLVGLPTGERSGLDVLDIDLDGLSWLGRNSGRLPLTRMHETKSGGRHLFFRHRPGLRCSTSKIELGVDVRADGGYVIWWPASGGRVLCEGPIAPWPASLDEALAEAEERRGRRTAEKPTDGTQMIWSPSQADYELPKRLYLKVLELMPGSRGRNRRRVLGLLRTLVQKTENRNHALNTLGFSFRELISTGVIDRTAAESLLIEAATLNGYIAKDGLGAAIATIRSGLGSQTIRVPSSLGEEENAP
jgi:hypothetical protein